MTETSTAVAPALNQLSASKSWMSVWVKIVHGGTPAGSASPGSRVSERSACGVPMPPAATVSWAAAKSLAKRRLKPTCRGMPAGSGRGDRAVGVGEGHRHRLLDEDGLAGPRGGDDEVGVRRAGARDGDGLDPGVVDERLRVGGPRGAEAPRRGVPPRRPGGRRRRRAGLTEPRANVVAWWVPMRPAPMRPMRTGSMRVMAAPSQRGTRAL